MGTSSRILGFSWSVLCAAALLACGGSQPAASSPAEPGAEPASESAGGGEVWSDTMSDKEKGMFMKKKVMPAMSKLFQEFNAEKYANFDCKTCHGPQFKPHPVDHLPELTFKDGQIVEAAEHPELATFMKEKVTPTMAELFGKKPYDPATHEGFGCNGCHKINM